MPEKPKTMLDIPATLEWLNARGFNYNLRQVQRIANERKLPFRVGPDGRRLFVSLSALESLVDQWSD
jgi:hypothetical protein